MIWSAYREYCARRGCPDCRPFAITERLIGVAAQRGTHQEQLTIEAANLRQDMNAAEASLARIRASIAYA